MLDIFVTIRPTLIESCETVCGISDHEVILTKPLILAEVCPSVKDVYTYGLKLTSIILDNLFSLFVKT